MLQRQLVFIFCINFCTNLAALFCVSAHTQEFYNARIQVLPAYIIASKADFLNSTCRKELQNFRDAVDQRMLWSLKVLDSSGVFKPGFLHGNNYWLGSRSQCLDTMNTVPLQILQRKILNNTLFRDQQQKFPPFQIHYFVAHFRHKSNLQFHVKNEAVITLGLCLPASCTINELSFIFKKIFHDRDILIDDLYFADFQLIQVKDLKGDNKLLFSGASYFICICLGLSFLMIAIGTMYDIFVLQKHVKKNEANKTVNGNVSKETEVKVNLSSHRKSKIEKVLISFSAYTNTREIFNVKLDTNVISVIHGLKFLNMCFVIMFHHFYYTMDFLDNKVWFRILIENYFPSLVNIISILVDNYFFSSGCLTTYLYLRKTNVELNKSTNCREKLIELFIHIIKRFSRLTPAYMMVLGLSQLSLGWFDKTSQFYLYERSHEICPKYWWRNLLYINNLFDWEKMCMSWSWYLANDMQFHVIGMMLLILSTKHFYIAATILSALLIGSAVLSGYISYVYEYVPILDELNRLADVVYTPPWMRINPYLFGIIAGYILIKLNSNMVLKRKVVILCWCSAGAFNIYVIASHSRYVTVLETAIYVVLHRIFWAISTAWIVIACSTKHGGIVNELLSFKGWIPLSRLTYCAYLINPLIIRSVNFYSNIAVHFKFLPFFVTSVGYVILTYFCSYALSLIIEIPYISLTRMFIHCHNGIHRKEL